MHPIHVASAAWVVASTPSKVPFYVAGAVLACLAVTGLTRPGFVGTAGTARLVMLTSGVLAAATITTAVTTAGPPTESEPAAAPPSNTLELSAPASGQAAYDVTSATVRPGEVAIRFANASIVPHNVTIARGERVIAATRTIESASTATSAHLEAGDYDFYCSVDGHRQAGMHGTLTVR
jgi:plastocyanin